MRYRYRLLGKWMTKQNVNIDAHNALHVIFGNRIPDEQMTFLRKICDKRGVLNIDIYTAYKKAFDTLFGGNVLFEVMVEILKTWSLSAADKKKYSEKLAAVLRVLNKDTKGGIPFRKYKLN